MSTGCPGKLRTQKTTDLILQDPIYPSLIHNYPSLWGGEGVNDESYTDLTVDKWTKWSDSISEFNPPHTEAKPTHMECVHIRI